MMNYRTHTHKAFNSSMRGKYMKMSVERKHLTQSITVLLVNHNFLHCHHTLLGLLPPIWMAGAETAILEAISDLYSKTTDYKLA